MSLRLKFILMLLAVFGLYGILTIVVQEQIVFPSFVSLEAEEAHKNMFRTVQAVDRDIDLLVPSVNDWSNWDDTRQYIQDHNPGYAEANLAAGTLEDMAINVMNLYDLEGNLVWGMGYDLEAEEEMELGELSARQLPTDHVLLAGPLADRPVSGIYMSSRGPLLVVANPILNNDDEGPSAGAVLMGRLLTPKVVARLSERMQLAISITPVADTATPEDWQGLDTRHLRHTPFVLESQDRNTDVFTRVSDLNGRPALDFHVVVPREISAKGRSAIVFSLASLMGVGVIVLAVLLVLLQRTVFRPVTLLTDHAVQVGMNDDLGTRIDLDRRDEIGTLAREFDQMTDRLSEARKSLLEQSYHAGVAEMASGVLHNIGNAVTPLNIKLGTVVEGLSKVPLQEMEMAFSELSGQGITEARRYDLGHFVELASQECAALVRRAREDLSSAVAQLGHLQQILNDQERFGHAKRLMEDVDLEPIIAQAVSALPEELCESIQVETDPALAGVGPVRASRVVLQQVVGNLLINAVEAVVARNSEEGGQIRVSASVDGTGADSMVHVLVADDGVGIGPEALEHIFERGYTTKARGSGIGLHWSANVVSAMGGRIYAESAGPGQGAILHLVLPPASARSQDLESAA